MDEETDPTAYLKLLAERLAELLDAEPDGGAMWKDELAREAEDRGWVTSAHHLRREPSWVFAMDLFEDNPIAFERLPFVGFELPEPTEIEDLGKFNDFIV